MTPPNCPKCGDNRQVWANQITGRMTCHRIDCHTEITQHPEGHTMKIRILKTHPSARVPEYASEGAAAFDLYAATVNGGEHIGHLVHPGSPVVVGTGLAFEVPDGHMLEIRSRSGLAFRHGVTAFAGTIDSDYRGEVRILLTCAHLEEDALPVKINPGDRVAQGVIVPAPRCVFEVAEQLTMTERGHGGFGSTGK